MLAGVLKGVSVQVHIAMVLKELDGWSWKDFDATIWFLSCVLLSIFKWWSWNESLEMVFVLFSMAEIDLETCFCIKLEWDLALNWLHAWLWFLYVSWSLQHKKGGLEMTYPSNAEVSVWYYHDLSAFHHHNILRFVLDLLRNPSFG